METRHPQPLIRLEDIQLVRRLGHGEFGTVFEGKWNNTRYAIKRINETLSYETELKFFTHLGHSPHVVSFIGTYVSPLFDSFIVMEYMPKGDLENLLFKSKTKLSSELQTSFMYDVAAAVNFLHNNNVLHRDIKPENMLLTEDMHVKLADFGLAIFKDEKKPARGGCIVFMPPESLKKDIYSERSDVYAMGLSFQEIITQKEMFEDLKDLSNGAYYWQTLARKESGVPQPIPETCPPRVAHLIQWCAKVDPSERPDAKQTLKEAQEIKDSAGHYSPKR